ncbi:uncharacterized protein TNCV_4811901 [Trichonephila clavipes]|nr:uncharacterized protein TNCV_4811901 [Trichonephila clavipes]
MSRLIFNKADKHTERQSKFAIHKCRSPDLGSPVFLAARITLSPLNALSPKKPPGPYNINGVMITHLGSSGIQRLLDIYNQSWKSDVKHSNSNRKNNVNFEPFDSKKLGDSEESIDAEKEEQPTRQTPINLANNTKMVNRNVPDVVRVPFFQMLIDPGNYFYSLLVQYVPFYSEDELSDEHYNAHVFNLLENPEEIVEAELVDEINEQAMANEQF